MSGKHDTAVSAQQPRGGEDERDFRAPKASKRNFTAAPRKSAVAPRVIESKESSPPSILDARSHPEQSQSGGSLPECRRYREIPETVQ